MNERLDIRKNQIDSLYREIGRFVVEFEMMCHAMQQCIVFIMLCHGLKNQQISHAVLAGQTAEPLSALLRTLISETIKLTKEEISAIDYLFKLIKKAIENRNQIIHSTWFIGWGNDSTSDWSVAKGIKHHKSKKGTSVKSLELTEEKFSSLTDKVIFIRKAVLVLMSCIVGNLPISDNFILRDGDGIDKLFCPHMPT